MEILKENNPDKPLISIVVPIYNVEKYLTQCIGSLINQTVKDIEIILVNDGSTDNCPAICDAYAQQDNRVRVIHQKNSGYGKACNAGIEAAMGKYLGILESDDYAELDMYERLYNAASCNYLDVTRCHYYFYNSRLGTRKRVDLSPVQQVIVYSCGDNPSVFFQAASVWAMLYQLDFLRKNNIRFLETPGASYQDISFTFKVYACAERFMLIKDTLVNYRIDNDNSSIHSKEKIFCVCDEYSEIERFLIEKKMLGRLSHILLKMKVYAYLWNYLRLNKKKRWNFIRVFAKEMQRCVMAINKKEVKIDNLSFKYMIFIYLTAYLYPVVHIYFSIISSKQFLLPKDCF